MLRIALILTTVIATFVGSLGLPVYLHTCRMLAMETQEAGCSMCDARDDGRPVVPSSEDSGPCCGDEVIHPRIDDGTLARIEMPMPLFAGIIVLFALDLTPIDQPSLATSDYGHSPPGLAARAQHRWLLNSTFLI